jgi:cell shape-determining protein MreD
LDWEQVKSAISLWTELERDALHIYAAILVQIAAAALLRRSLASPLPLLVVLAAALLNEALDITRDGVFEDWERGAALHDLWNSMLVPTLLALLVRFAPRLFVRERQPPPSE